MSEVSLVKFSSLFVRHKFAVYQIDVVSQQIYLDMNFLYFFFQNYYPINLILECTKNIYLFKLRSMCTWQLDLSFII